MTSNNESLEFSVRLLEQLMSQSQGQKLTQFNDLDSLVAESFLEDKGIPKSNTPAAVTVAKESVVAANSKEADAKPASASTNPNAGKALGSSASFDVFAPESVSEQADSHHVGTQKLARSGSKHLEKNEKLIKALEELRSKMNKKGLRSGKVIRPSEQG